jgi:hypothetical protein
MQTDWIVEPIKLVGSLLGIATAAFIVYDRLVSGRPVFAISAKPGSRSRRDNWKSTRKPWPFRRRIKTRVTVAKLKEWKEAHLPGLPFIS